MSQRNTKGSRKKGGKSFTQSFSETKTLLLTFVLSYERMKLKIREGLIILLMLPRAECGSAVGRALSPLKTNEKRPQACASKTVKTLGRFDSGPRETFYQIAQQTVA